MWVRKWPIQLWSGLKSIAEAEIVDACSGATIANSGIAETCDPALCSIGSDAAIHTPRITSASAASNPYCHVVGQPLRAERLFFYLKQPLTYQTTQLSRHERRVRFLEPQTASSIGN